MSGFARRTLFTGIAALAVLAGVAFPSGAGMATAAARLPDAIPASPVGSIYASDFYTPALLAYKPGSSGDATPDRDVTGADTGMSQVTDVAVDSSGTGYLSDDNNSILEYWSDARGDSTPKTTISGSATGLNFPSALALAPNGNIWVANFDGGSLLEFAAGASGDAAPLAVIHGSNTGLGDTAGIAVSPDGKDVWASNRVPSAGSLTEYSTGDTGNVTPITTIAGSKTGLTGSAPWGLAVDTDGAVWVSVNSDSAPAILEFSRSADGDVEPDNGIVGADTGLADPTGIILDPFGDLLVADEGHDDIAEWKTGNQGAGDAPDVTISGADTGLNQQDSPDGVAIYWIRPNPANDLVATAVKRGVSLHWQAPYGTAAATEVTGYIVDRATSANGPFAPIAQTSHRSYTDRDVTLGRTYFYRLFADNHVSISQSGEDDRSATPVGPPSAPRAVKAKSHQRSIRLSWKPPVHLNGSTITGYSIEYANCKVGRPHCKAKSTTVSRTARHHTIRRLHAGKRYFFEVLAQSSSGTGRVSKRVKATPKP